jgi:hypothetical protein
VAVVWYSFSGKENCGMTKLLVRDLDPEAVARREAQVAEEKAEAPRSREESLRIAREWQRRLAGRVTGDSADLIREDRER